MSEAVFFGAFGFVLGSIAGGVGVSPLFSLLACAFCALFVFSTLSAGLTDRLSEYPPLFSRVSMGRTVALIFLISFFLGTLYFAIDDFRYHTRVATLSTHETFDGIIIDNPRKRGQYEMATVRSAEGGVYPKDTRILLFAEKDSALAYGERVSISGVLTPPPQDSYGAYLSAKNIHGTAFFQPFERYGYDGAWYFRALFSINRAIQDMLFRLYPPEEAAFLLGVLLGERDAFSPEFVEKLSHSGTIHLTALSGLHMAILIFILFAVVEKLLPKHPKRAYVVVASFVGIFVALTGFKISAMRASLMALLAGLAERSGRAYSRRNAIVFAGFLITLFHPKAPVFDLAFQLSFLATLSIMYLAPVLRRLSFFQKEGVFLWREILVITLSAQLGVLPITVFHFANFSFSALPANVFILVIIAPLLVLGFLSVLLSFLYFPLGTLASYPASVLARYSIEVVEIFYALRVPFNPDFGLMLSFLYYGVLVFLAYRFLPKDGFSQSTPPGTLRI